MLRLTIEIDDDAAESITKIGLAQRMTSEQTVAYLLDRTLYGVTRRLSLNVNDYKPQSIMVMVDDVDDDVLKHFRCPNCGNIVFDYCGATRLIMNGRYDRDGMMFDGETVKVEGFGQPTRIACQSRMLMQYPDGRTKRVSCGNVFYKLKA